MDEFLTITEAARLIAAHKVSPVDLMRHCLARIRRIDPVLHSFIAVTEERALRDARAAEARVMAGTGRGKLDGIPIAHKDIYCTAGIATTAHSKQLQGYIPDEDAATVRKLAEAGTVLLGKLATHEFAFGGPAFDLPWPPARNPWNPEHFTGGSSSGTAAAVAAGLILGGTGSDTAGSIRAPAALCGITGIKPTCGLYGRVGILPLAFSMDHAGPLAWTVEDCALLLHAMAGPDHSDRASAGRVAPDYTATLNGWGQGYAHRRIEALLRIRPPGERRCAQRGSMSAIDIFRRLGAESGKSSCHPWRTIQHAGGLSCSPEAFARARAMDPDQL